MRVFVLMLASAALAGDLWPQDRQLAAAADRVLAAAFVKLAAAAPPPSGPAR